MLANDCLRRLRYILDVNDAGMIAIFAEADHVVNDTEIRTWLLKDDDQDFAACNDLRFSLFLDGLINLKRGKKDGPVPEPQQRLTNNMILRKLKIAFDLKADDILELMSLAEFRISKHELSAFFRRADHKHYRECKDQILRNFLTGLQIRHRGDKRSNEGSSVVTGNTPNPPFRWKKPSI